MHRLNSPIINLLIVAFIYGIYLFLLLSKLEYNPAYLISLGEKFANFDSVPKNLVIWKNYGYDGQFYYRLALNPFTSEKEEFGITIDIPSYRHQRIIYPLISWIFSLGQKDFVPIQVSFLLIFTISVFNAFASSKALAFKKIAWILYLLMAISYTSYIWVADIAFFRTLTEFYIIGAAILLSSKSKVKAFVFLLTAVFCLLSIKQFGYFL